MEGGHKPSVRGDIMTYVSSTESVPRPGFVTLTRRMDSLIMQVLERVPEIREKKLMRDAAMCSCYPGSGARYLSLNT